MDKVISSNITRSFNKKNEELYELLKVVPARPVPLKPVKVTSCNFQPRNDKQYIPKKKLRQKVKTVRDIRNLFEKDMLNELPADLEKQQNYLLRKIKTGFLREDKTIAIARNMIMCDKPLTKSSWQMLMNINPECHAYPLQYILWNGKYIRINGSKGGKNKFICKYDLARNKTSLKNRSSIKKNTFNKKKGLLQNSLSVDFKPGPLARKKFLDNSYQKYHVGHIDVVNLPKPGLDVQPLYGIALDPTISSFVNKLREENGGITQKWAEFAVTVLGSISGSNINQTNREKSVTFDLSYKNEQTKLLMRQDSYNKCDIKKIEYCGKFADSQIKLESGVLPEVKVMMNDMLNAVEINLNQDLMCKEDDEIREDCQSEQLPNNIKEKNKKRYCELDRLDVTVIRLNESENDKESSNPCNNSYCALGCICNSLQSTVVLKGHCGRIDCMFQCKCDFSNYAMADGLNDCLELLPSLYNLKNEINCTLSKEEQKFHQTVILSGDKSILLKSKKRSCKSPKNYEDYYSNLCLKSKSNVKRILTIIEPKLNCENIEPWCMVHNLYKCFCKGRFTETACNEFIIGDINKKTTETINDSADNINGNGVEVKLREKDNYYQKPIKTHSATRGSKSNVEIDENIYEIDSDDETNSCARSKAYKGRKFSDNHYLFANEKIQELEINDSKLRKRLQKLVDDSSTGQNNVRIEEIEVIENDQDIVEIEEPQCSPLPEPNTNKKTTITMVDGSSTDRCISDKPRMVEWLESSYQDYKRRLDMGISRSNLEPPSKGKVILYQWDFILNRYSERKNLFLVSKQSPYRIFMAVQFDSPLLENCINIDEIRFADLTKYPTTVKNLLTNTSPKKDFFCILYGHSNCWEFIGTVTKVGDQKKSDLGDPKIPKTTGESQQASAIESPNLLVDLDDEASMTIATAIQQMSPTAYHSPKQSKWFIMIVESDFSELHFHNRGFFVTYKSIIHSLNIARLSGKTVRLSPSQCADYMNDETLFALYATPMAHEYCVFVGPFDINEPLGVEPIKTISDGAKRKRTRGIWITIDKDDISKVLDDPLSFIPAQRSEYKDLEFIDTSGKDLTFSSNDITQTQHITQTNENSTEEFVKVIKPIKISRFNGFYNLNSSSILKRVSVLKSPNNLGLLKPKTLILKPATTTANLTSTPIITERPSCTSIIHSEPESQHTTASLLPTKCGTGAKVNQNQNRPVAEVAPQIKISAVYSKFDPEKTMQRKRKEGGMFILKPEEINQRLVIDGNRSPKAGSSKSLDKDELDMAMDIEHFLDTSNICPAPENETFVISDDEDISSNNTEDIKDIFIECTNIENLGALRGEKHITKGIRFDFPGFRISDYYNEDEVFTKINQVLSRRIYIPSDLNLEWRIVNSMSELKSQRLLKKESFGSNLVLTPQGIKKKSGVKHYVNIKTYLNKNKNIHTKTHTRKWTLETDKKMLNQIHCIPQEFGKESPSIEEESTDLLYETVSSRNSIIRTIVEASDTEREEFASTLRDIENMSNSGD